MDVADVDELSVGEPKQLEYVATVQDGYLQTKTHKAVWAIKQADGQVTVFSPMCTHLGCGYHWDATDRKFKCPCHGSGFFKSGLNFEGPAPRPLDRFKIAVGEDGQLVVDKSKVFKMAPGGEPDEQYPDSVLKA